MTQYLLSVHTSGGEVRESRPDEETQRSSEQLARLEKEMESTGTLIFSGRLHEPTTASVVRMSGGETLITDGPFIESKEQIGGFYIISADDLDAALTWASKTSDAIKMPIEVRPFWDARVA